MCSTDNRAEKQYVKKTIRTRNTVEVRKYYSRRLGARGNGRARRKNPTPWQVEEYHWQEARDNLRLILEENFGEGDLWIRLSYPRGTRKEPEAVKKDIQLFLRRIRGEYKKAGADCRYVFTAGLGAAGGLHFHLVMNKFHAATIERIWHETVGTKECPHPSTNVRHLYEQESMSELAKYIVKNSREVFGTERQIFGRRYCASKNLKQPEITRELVKAAAWRKKPSIPLGWRLLGEVRNGESLYGFPFQRYVLVRDNTAESPIEKKRRRRRISDEGRGFEEAWE